MTTDSIAASGSCYFYAPRTVEPSRAAPTRGDSCDVSCRRATASDGSGLLDDLPGSVPFDTHLARGNRRGRAIEAHADPAGAHRRSSGSPSRKPQAGPDLGWPKLGDAPAPAPVRLVRVIERVYRVERLTKPGTYLDMLA